MPGKARDIPADDALDNRDAPPHGGTLTAMNWLAHLYLSPPGPAHRMGNLLPDLVPAGSLAALPEELQPGIALHRSIDAFTDRHPVMRRSIQRLPAEWRRYGGILCDVFYDHLLARDWARYSTVPLAEFAREVYAGFDEWLPFIPEPAAHRLRLMREGDLLGSYQSIAGIAAALERISLRLRRPVALAGAAHILEQESDAFTADFREFFPALEEHAAAVCAAAERAVA